MTLDAAALLTGIPGGLRGELLERYREIARNYIEHRWEPAELNGGKFAEVVYSIVAGAVAGAFPKRAAKPADFAGACRTLESKPNTGLPGDRSLRILIPRQLVALYEIRNNRGVGHVGGDVNPNSMDASAVFSTSRWVMAELIRVFHDVSTDIAQSAVDALSERVVPAVWVVPGANLRRVLAPGHTSASQTLLLLHTRAGWTDETELFESIEYGRPADFRRKILRPLHTLRLIEYDSKGGRVHLTPKGSTHAEALLQKQEP